MAPSLPIGLGVSCSADRQVLGKITKDGVYLEDSSTTPRISARGGAVARRRGGKIDLNQPMKDILATLSKTSDQDPAVADRHHDRRA